MKTRVEAPIDGFRLPRYQEVPDVGLYLEQVTGYISNLLSPLVSISITGSMISNYVKKDLISNPIKKRYNRDQIVALICIAVAKTVLSLEDIQVLLSMQRTQEYVLSRGLHFCVRTEEAMQDLIFRRQQHE